MMMEIKNLVVEMKILRESWKSRLYIVEIWCRKLEEWVKDGLLKVCEEIKRGEGWKKV